MPPTAPGSLTDEEYAGVVAYLLRENDGPPSDTPLGAASAGQVMTSMAAAATGASRSPEPGHPGNVHSVKVDADRRTGRIQILDQNGQFLEMLDEIAQPSHIVVAEDQAACMSDPTLNRLVQFNQSGMHLIHWGAAEGLPGAFSNPHHFDVDTVRNLYVADYGNHGVQKFVPRPGADARRLIQPAFVSINRTHQ